MSPGRRLRSRTVGRAAGAAAGLGARISIRQRGRRTRENSACDREGGGGRGCASRPRASIVGVGGARQPRVPTLPLHQPGGRVPQRRPLRVLPRRAHEDDASPTPQAAKGADIALRREAAPGPESGRGRLPTDRCHASERQRAAPVSSHAPCVRNVRRPDVAVAVPARGVQLLARTQAMFGTDPRCADPDGRACLLPDRPHRRTLGGRPGICAAAGDAGRGSLVLDVAGRIGCPICGPNRPFYAAPASAEG
mmetsp:Transcript_116873/g.324910  ORF Transcript_116873/g.324910 Transcript_116873/m.324910 type:complete len:251 (-) Transcript_116873:101-853(-)